MTPSPSPSPFRRYLLPLILGGLGLLLLLRVILINSFVLVPEDLDIIILVILLSVALVIAIHTIVRLSMNYLRELSVQRVRRETIAEHSRFLRRLDHELKNPLTTLRAGLRTLSLTPLDDPQQQIVATMERETLRLSRLVDDLRKLAELEAQPLNLQPFNLEAFIHNLIEIEEERFSNGRRTLTAQLDTPHPTWVADEDLLALALHNLLDNAYKYTEPGDTIQLSVTSNHDLHIQLSDSGPGIPPDVQPLIWEELFRAGQNSKITGSGIGLALVKAIIERHNGTVHIHSQPDQGTTISLRLPPVA